MFYSKAKETITKIARESGAVVSTTGCGKRRDGRRTLSVEAFRSEYLNWECAPFPDAMIDRLKDVSADFAKVEFERRDPEKTPYGKRMKKALGYVPASVNLFAQDIKDPKLNEGRWLDGAFDTLIMDACDQHNEKLRKKYGVSLDKYREMTEYQRAQLYFAPEGNTSRGVWLAYLIKPIAVWKVKLILPPELSQNEGEPKTISVPETRELRTDDVVYHLWWQRWNSRPIVVMSKVLPQPLRPNFRDPLIRLKPLPHKDLPIDQTVTIVRKGLFRKREDAQEYADYLIAKEAAKNRRAPAENDDET